MERLLVTYRAAQGKLKTTSGGKKRARAKRDEYTTPSNCCLCSTDSTADRQERERERERSIYLFKTFADHLRIKLFRASSSAGESWSRSRPSGGINTGRLIRFWSNGSRAQSRLCNLSALCRSARLQQWSGADSQVLFCWMLTGTGGEMDLLHQCYRGEREPQPEPEPESVLSAEVSQSFTSGLPPHSDSRGRFLMMWELGLGNMAEKCITCIISVDIDFF